MNILNNNYISEKLQELRVTYFELRKERDLVNINDNCSSYLKGIIEKMDRLIYKTQCYDETQQMLKIGSTKNEIINSFKIKLNKQRYQLKRFEGLFGKENASQVGTPVYSKRLEVEELQHFMESEIFKYI